MSLPLITGDQTTTLAWFAEMAYEDSWTADEVLGWQLVSGSELGISNSLLANGHYTNANGSALVTSANFNGSDVLCIAFRGSDDYADWVTNLSDIDEHFELFQALTDAAQSALAAGTYDAILVTGHSLGGAMTEVFLHTYSDPNMFGISWGSPGMHMDEAVSDSRLVNYVFTDDGVAWLGNQRDDIADEVNLWSLGDFAEVLDGLGIAAGFSLVAALTDLDGDYQHQGTTALISADGSYVGAFDSGITLDNFAPYIDTHDMGRYLVASTSLNANPFTLPDSVVAGTELTEAEETVLYLADAVYGDLPDSDTFTAYSDYLAAGGREERATSMLLVESGLTAVSRGALLDTLYNNIYGRDATAEEEAAIAAAYFDLMPHNLVLQFATGSDEVAAMASTVDLVQALGTVDLA